MKKKSDKKKDIDALHQDLEQSGNLFVTGYEKLRVDQDFELRKAVRGAGGKYRVIKNNLAEIAAQGTPSEAVLKSLRGMTSLAYTSNDPVALSKALTTYAKANPSFTFKAGIVEGRAIDVRAINELASMPSKEQIFSKLLYLINAPAQRLVTVMQAVGRNLAEIAAQGTPSEAVLKNLRGMTSLAYTSKDPVALAKALTIYAKANPSFTFKAGIVEGRAIDVGAIHELASMPSKEEIFSKLLYLINAPAQRLVTVIQAVGRNLAVVVDQGVKENKFQA